MSLKTSPVSWSISGSCFNSFFVKLFNSVNKSVLKVYLFRSSVSFCVKLFFCPHPKSENSPIVIMVNFCFILNFIYLFLIFLLYCGNIAARVSWICVHAGFGAQSFNLLLKFIRSKKLQVYTSGRLTQNPYWRFVLFYPGSFVMLC